MGGSRSVVVVFFEARDDRLQLGILDGMRGLVFCMLQAYGTYTKWSILWSWRVNEARGIEPDLPVFDESEETWSGLEDL